MTWFTRIDSPVGPLLLVASEAGLEMISFCAKERPERVLPEWVEDRAPFSAVIEQLEAYFAGRLREFDVPLALKGTAFQLRVWEALRSIPYGATTSYGALAKLLGDVKATRAVGLANGRNPVPIIVPCHRVIGADGSLTGFGGGLPIKRKLLVLEGARAEAQGSLFGD